MTILHMLFSAKGRIRRRDYWLWSLGIEALVLVVAFLIAAALHKDSDKGSSASLGGIVLTLTLPFLYWMQICLQIKRWHDRNKSGVMIFINFIPVIGPWWAFAETCVLDGTKGANQYGPSPKGADTTARLF